MEKVKKLLNEGKFTHKTLQKIVQKRTEKGILQALSTKEAFRDLYPDSEAVFQKIFDVRRRKSNDKCPCCELPISKFWKRVATYKYICRGCKTHFHPLADTPLRGAHKELHKILEIAHDMFNSKHSVSAREIQRAYGWKYRTAHKWGLRMRLWMGLVVGNLKFDGRVEGDETFVKIPSGMPKGFKFSRGLGSERIAPVVTITSSNGNARGIVVDYVDKDTIREIYQENVVPGSHINTDGKKVYRFLGNEGYKHSECNHKKKIWSTEDHVHCNTNESLHHFYKGVVGVILKGVSLEYLQFYLDQVSWVFSNRHNDALTAIESLFDVLPSFHEKGKITINTKIQ